MIVFAVNCRLSNVCLCLVLLMKFTKCTKTFGRSYAKFGTLNKFDAINLILILFLMNYLMNFMQISNQSHCANRPRKIDSIFFFFQWDPIKLFTFSQDSIKLADRSHQMKRNCTQIPRRKTVFEAFRRQALLWLNFMRVEKEQLLCTIGIGHTLFQIIFRNPRVF